MQMSYRYPYNDPGLPQDTMSPTTPSGASNASTPVNNPWDYDVAPLASNPAQQPQNPTTSTNLLTLHRAEFSPQDLSPVSVAPAVSSPAVIQLEERVPVVPSQYHRSRIRTTSGESKFRMHVQKDASGANTQQPGGTSTGAARSSGLVRTSPMNARRESTRAHPYCRPHSAGSEGVAARAPIVGAAKTSRSVSDHTRISPFTAENSSGLTRMSPPPAVPGTTPSQSTSPSKVYSIRTDIHFNINTNTMTAMLELPGVKHSELSVTLATEPYTHARQITVSGRTYPPFAEPTPEDRERTKRERKFGEFLRRFQVPPHTQVCLKFFIVVLPDAPGCVFPGPRH
ncbi:hypothetical protein B0F90DRAFT_1702313 [Multifurca ochricompacta]|uniref:Uncharacterized protein n=1 Tax=Multifurca ochricompacta TaxID=376703 RepID=A0AAD4QQI7_9AGAM|nr:hypothetical protein B0F90DRAFT_1702313 [Multifurca ochricompacta]